jgi:hypothetical protein
MDGIQTSIEVLKSERNKILSQLEAVDNAIKALGGAATKGGKSGKKRKKLSPEARKKLSDAAKKRWANQKRAAKS